MNQRQSRLAFVICGVLFVLALGLTLLPSGGSSADSPVQISEVLASNRTYPAPNGQYYDFIELTNLSDAAVDLSGWQLADQPDRIGYTVPIGTVLQPGAAFLCWTDRDGEAPYGSFGISAGGKDTLRLYNGANVQVQSLAVPTLPENQSYALQADGSWAVTDRVTPGFSNDEAGYEAFLSRYDLGSLTISEIMTSNKLLRLPGGQVSDWVELHNPGTEPISLDGCWLSDDPAKPLSWRLPDLMLDPGAYAVIPCTGADAEGEASFALSKSGCTVLLTGPLGNELSRIEVPALESGSTWANIGDQWAVSDRPTPGFENSDQGFALWQASLGPVPTLTISEVLPGSRSFLMDGILTDWAELCNDGAEPLSLEGLFLSDDPGQRDLWPLHGSLEPGSRAAFPCPGLSRRGCTLYLTGDAGQPLGDLSVPPLEPDRSWALMDGTYAICDRPSPGFENTDQGHQRWQQSLSFDSPLQISEAMASNDACLRQPDGRYYDWVELQNISTAPVELSDYCLSDSRDDPARFVLPSQILQPGERFLILCSGGVLESATHPQANFSLSRSESWLYLSTAHGQLVDCLHLLEPPAGCSVGRPAGQWATVYFDEPTPGAANGAGLFFSCPLPELTVPDGIYDGVDQVEAALSSPHTIRYTLDGSLPTANSPVYEGPISLTKTTVLRARAFAPDQLPSAALSATYVINEGHTLPVLSLCSGPNQILGDGGIYKNYEDNREVPCNLTFYEDGRAFSIDCGIKMHGHTGLKNPKKSFKVNFRSQYGPGSLDFPVYGPDAPAHYDSLCIRSGQDYPFSIFRDELFTTLCRQLGDNVLAQRDKFCILYINGRYWGIYCLKEAFSETFYADNRGVPVETVTMAQAPVHYGSDMLDILSYCRSHDLSQPEHYEHVAARVDVDSLIDWMIMEGYSTNGDVQQNLRYFKDDTRGWQMAYYDLDWAFYYHNPMTHVLSDKKDWQHMPLTVGMMQNPEFRKKFLSRLSEALEGPLSDENVLSVIDSYAALLDPEVPRERDRWISTYDAWLGQVETLRRFVRSNHIPDIIDSLRGFIGLTAEEEETYFGRWTG